jgi:hypothetical protein
MAGKCRTQDQAIASDMLRVPGCKGGIEMKRHELIQRVIDKKQARTYLEIGVQSGDTFLNIRATKKMAVDPHFLIPWTVKLRWLRWNHSNLFNEYFEMPSDQFFRDYSAILSRRKMDVIFVDGLHTYQQSLRDVQNSLLYLQHDGVIIIDDTNPSSETAASPVKAHEQHEWNGDVWKSIAHLRSLCSDVDVFTLDCIYGISIVTRKAPRETLGYTESEIAALTYDDLRRYRSEILNIRDVSYFAEFLESLTCLR